MRQVPPHPVWIGHAGDGRDFRALLDANIQAVVQLALEEPPLQPPRELICCRFPLVDGEGNSPTVLALAATTIAQLLRRAVPTLVCCGNGMSRAPALAAAGLALLLGEKPESCLLQVLGEHGGDVSPALWNEVRLVVEASAG